MGAVFIALAFVVGLIGVPSLFGPHSAHAEPQAEQQQDASAKTPAATPASATYADAADERP